MHSYLSIILAKVLGTPCHNENFDEEKVSCHEIQKYPPPPKTMLVERPITLAGRVILAEFQALKLVNGFEKSKHLEKLKL